MFKILSTKGLNCTKYNKQTNEQMSCKGAAYSEEPGQYNEKLSANDIS